MDDNKNQFTNNLELYYKRLFEGLAELQKEKLWPEELIPATSFQHLALNPDYMRENFSQGYSCQEVLGITDEEIQRFYSHAQSLYNDEEYEMATNVLLLLTFLSPRMSSLWVSLGMSEHRLKQFESAIMAYAIALEIEPFNLMPTLYIAQCLTKLHRVDKAKLLLQDALKASADDVTQETFRDKAIDMLCDLTRPDKAA